MSLKEDKFPILLGSVTAVVAGGLIWWGMQSGTAYEESKTNYDDSVSEIQRLLRAKVAPTSDNLREKKNAVAEYRASVDELQKAFDKYRQVELKNTGVSEFTDALLAAKERLSAKFVEGEVAMPAEFFLGLGKYTDKLPQQKNTGLLHFELQAFEDLFGRLAEAGPTELLNVHWPDLPEEIGQTYEMGDAGYRAHPIEITFAGSEDSLRKFMSSLDDSEKYFYLVRTMRVSNSRKTAPNSKDATFEAPPAPASDSDPFPDFGGGDFVFPTEEDGEEPAEGGEEGADESVEAPAEPEEPAAPVVSDSGQILKQVLGGEEIQVFMRIDVLQFVQPKELPKE